MTTDQADASGLRSDSGTSRLAVHEHSSEITVRIDTPAALFDAPDVNPFSDWEGDVLGEAGRDS